MHAREEAGRARWPRASARRRPRPSAGNPTIRSVDRARPGSRRRAASTRGAILAPAVGTAHGREHAVVGRLQRHVQVAGDQRLAERVEQVGGEVTRLDRRQAQAAQLGQLHQAADQAGQVVAARRVAVGADVDAGEHDLAAAGREGVRACSSASPAARLQGRPRTRRTAQYEQLPAQPSCAFSVKRVRVCAAAPAGAAVAAGAGLRGPAASSTQAATASGPAAMPGPEPARRRFGSANCSGRSAAAQPATTTGRPWAARRRASWREERSASPVTPQVSTTSTSAWAGSATGLQPRRARLASTASLSAWLTLQPAKAACTRSGPAIAPAPPWLPSSPAPAPWGPLTARPRARRRPTRPRARRAPCGNRQRRPAPAPPARRAGRPAPRCADVAGRRHAPSRTARRAR